MIWKRAVVVVNRECQTTRTFRALSSSAALLSPNSHAEVIKLLVGMLIGNDQVRGALRFANCRKAGVLAYFFPLSVPPTPTSLPSLIDSFHSATGIVGFLSKGCNMQCSLDPPALPVRICRPRPASNSGVCPILLQGI